MNLHRIISSAQLYGAFRAVWGHCSAVRHSRKLFSAKTPQNPVFVPPAQLQAADRRRRREAFWSSAAKLFPSGEQTSAMQGCIYIIHHYIYITPTLLKSFRHVLVPLKLLKVSNLDTALIKLAAFTI